MLPQCCISQMINQAKDEGKDELANILSILKGKDADELEFLYNVCVDLYLTDDRVMNITGPDMEMTLSNKDQFALVAKICKYIMEVK